MHAVITTEHRGVFFGEIDPKQREHKTLTIQNAQMCVYWSADVKGIVGLAATGPTEGCRITAAAPSITVNAVTAVMEASDEAVLAWKASSWR